MGGALNIVAIGAQVEGAVLGIQIVLFNALNGALIHGAIVDQIRNGANLEIVQLGESLQIFTAGHGAIVVHDLADHSGRLTPCQCRQITGRLGMACPAENAARIRHQRKDMTRLNQIRSLCAPGNGGLNRAGTIRGGNAGGHAFSGLDREGELGPETGMIAVNHQRQTELLTAGTGHWHADQTTTKPRHEIDGLRRAEFRSHHQIAFVFAIFVIHQDDHLALPDICNDLFYAVQCHNLFAPSRSAARPELFSPEPPDCRGL